jgi:hypothetical protein
VVGLYRLGNESSNASMRPLVAEGTETFMATSTDKNDERQTAAERRKAAEVGKAADQGTLGAVEDGKEFPVVDEVVSIPDDPTFSRERLLGPEGSVIAESPAHIIAGALELSNRNEFTKAQAREAVEAFLSRPVKQEG